MLIKRGDVKILSVLEEEELNEKQKKAVKEFISQPNKSNDATDKQNRQGN